MANINNQQVNSKTTNPVVGDNGTSGSNSATATTIFNPNTNTPGTQEAAPTPVAKPGDIAPSELSQASGYFRTALMNDFSNKTLYQDAFTIDCPQVEEFVHKIGFKEYTPIIGKYKEYGIILPQRGTKYSLDAFIPSSSNVATGATSIRKDVHNQWTNKFRVGLVDADVDSNMITKRLDITKELYTEKFVSGKLDEFINEASTMLKKAQELELYNKFIFGYDAIVEGSTKTQNGLAQLIQVAKTDTQVNIGNANLTRNMIYDKLSALAPSKPQAIAQLNEIIWKMLSPNQTFGFMNSAQDGTTKNSGIPTQVRESDLVVVMNKKLQESLAASELNFFKSLKDLFPKLEIAIIPPTTLDTSFVDDAAQVVAPIKDINLSLADDEILIIDKSKWYQLTSNPSFDVETQYFPNNRTLSNWVFSKPTQGYLPNGSIVVYKAPILLANFALDINNTN